MCQPKTRVRFYLSIYLVTAALYLLTASGRIGLSDSVSMLNVAQSIIKDGSLSSEPCDPNSEGQPNHCVIGTNGRHYSGFGLVPSFAVIPALLGARVMAAAAHISPNIISKVAASIFTALIGSLVPVVFAIWIHKLGYSNRVALAGAFIVGFASPIWVGSVKGFLSEPYFTVALIVAGLLLSHPRNKQACVLSGLAFGIACGARINGAILFPAFILALAASARVTKQPVTAFVRDVWQFSAPFAMCMGLLGLANYTRFGSPLKTGYHLAFPTISMLLPNALLPGLGNILFDGEVGLLIFAPWIIAALLCLPWFVRAHPSEAVLTGAIFLTSLLFFAKYQGWHGGWVIGPRFLTPVLPFLALSLTVAFARLRRPDWGNSSGSRFLRWVGVISVGGSLLIQCVTVMFPSGYFVVKEFYEAKKVRVWWLGSVPLATIQYLAAPQVISGSSRPPIKLVDQNALEVARQEQEVWASVSSATTLDQFLNRFPNPYSFARPNVMLIQGREIGVPIALSIIYFVFASAMGLIGLVGLRNEFGSSTKERPQPAPSEYSDVAAIGTKEIGSKPTGRPYA